MSLMRCALTATELRSVLDYDSETGVFKWRKRMNRKGHVGAPAGTPDSKGYVQIRLYERAYKAHRLAWLHTYGVWPQLVIDHINGDRTDNRIANLRQATGSQNHANSRRYKNNTSGVKGVSWVERVGKWRAYIVVNRRQTHLGLFDNREDAAASYRAAAEAHFGEFCRTDGGSREPNSLRNTLGDL